MKVCERLVRDVHTDSVFKTWSGEAGAQHPGRFPRSKFRNRALSSPPPSSRLAPYSKTGRSRRKKALSSPTPGHLNKVPGGCRLTLSSAFLFPCRSTDSPNPHRHPTERASPVLPPWWTWEVAAQSERTRTKKGPPSDGEERGENAGPGDRGLGLCRPVELTPSSCPQRPSSQLPSALEFRVPSAVLPRWAAPD